MNLKNRTLSTEIEYYKKNMDFLKKKKKKKKGKRNQTKLIVTGSKVWFGLVRLMAYEPQIAIQYQIMFVHTIWFFSKQVFGKIIFKTNQSSFVCTQLNGSPYYYLLLVHRCSQILQILIIWY